MPCLGQNAVTFSKKAAEFLTSAISIVPDIHGHVMISPLRPPTYCTVYMNHFCSGTGDYCPIGREPYMDYKEWQDYCFLRGVEWFNLLTPFQTKKLIGRTCSDKFHVLPMPNGGCTVISSKNILQTQVSDLCSIKRYLYPILHPGGLEIPFKPLSDITAVNYIVKPRCRWENLPVLDEELVAHPDRITLTYQTGWDCPQE